MAGGVLFLDISLSVGWAWGTEDHIEKGPVCGVWTLNPAWDLGRRLAAFENELADAIWVHQPKKIGAEAPILGGKGSTETLRLQISLAGCAHSVAYRWDRPIVERASQTLRSQVIGRAFMTEAEQRTGLTVKEAIVRPWIDSRGWNITDHNACDAAVGWAFEIGVRAPGRKRAA